MRPAILLAVCYLFFFTPAANAEFYRWIDKDGKENFTNDPAKIPSGYRERSSPVEVGSDRVSIGEKAPGAVSAKGTGDEHRDKNGRGEEWWRRRAENLRREIRDLEDEYALVLKKEQEQEQKTGGRKSKSRTNYAQKKMQLEKKIAQARRRLEVDLTEEARKADAYPGWLRE